MLSKFFSKESTIIIRIQFNFEQYVHIEYTFGLSEGSHVTFLFHCYSFYMYYVYLREPSEVVISMRFDT